MEYHEVSAKTGNGVAGTFESIANKYVSKKLNPENQNEMKRNTILLENNQP